MIHLFLIITPLNLDRLVFRFSPCKNIQHFLLTKNDIPNHRPDTCNEKKTQNKTLSHTKIITNTTYIKRIFKKKLHWQHTQWIKSLHKHSHVFCLSLSPYNKITRTVNSSGRHTHHFKTNNNTALCNKRSQAASLGYMHGTNCRDARRKINQACGTVSQKTVQLYEWVGVTLTEVHF